MQLVFIGLIGIGAAAVTALFGFLVLKFNESLANGDCSGQYSDTNVEPERPSETSL